jgi:hypothetical protein
MVGTDSATNLAGTYTDTRGDAGTWTASTAGPLDGSYSGTFNSSTSPMSITPSILFSLTQTQFSLTGATIFTSFPCSGSLTVSGQAIGQAFTLTDTANTVKFTAVPAGSNFNFAYTFAPPRLTAREIRAVDKCPTRIRGTIETASSTHENSANWLPRLAPAKPPSVSFTSMPLIR